MSDFLFGYYSIGLKALNAANAGLSVAGNNIANVNTAGYSRRRIDLQPGHPLFVKGGQLDQGVDVHRIRREEDRYLQATLEREMGRLGYSEQQLRGLRDIEATFGTLESNSILPAYSEFSSSFAVLAGDPTDPGLRRSAVSASQALAQKIRVTHQRLVEQRRSEDRTAEAQVAEINSLAEELAGLNEEIVAQEADGTTAAGQRDRRDGVVEELTRLTGGRPATASNGKVAFSFQGGPTLVTTERALTLTTSRDSQGFLRIASATGADITDDLREGELGGLLGVRDDSVPARLAELDAIAFDLIARANMLTAASSDLNGDPGGPLFQPDPPSATGAAAVITVSQELIDDPAKLAVSATGAPSDGFTAIEISKLQETKSGVLGFKSPQEYLSDALATLGGDVARADVDATVSQEMVDTLSDRKQATVGVSLDEEAVELIRNQRAYEAAARFMQVLNDVTEVAVNLI